MSKKWKYLYLVLLLVGFLCIGFGKHMECQSWREGVFLLGILILASGHGFVNGWMIGYDSGFKFGAKK